MKTAVSIEEQNTLEALIDKHGLPNVLEALGQICHEKAEHIQSNWQDAPLSKLWSRAGRALDRATAHAAYQTLP